MAGRPLVVCDYNLEIQPNRVSATTAVVTVGRFDELVAGGRLPQDLRAQLAAAPDGHVRVADLYLTWADPPSTAEERSAALHAALAASGLADEVRRIVGRGGPSRRGLPRIEYFTFRRRVATGPANSSEDTLVRGVHPLVGRRLHLWRLQNFHVTRLLDPGGGAGACTAFCFITAWPRTTPTTSGWWRWRRCTGSRSSRGPDGRVTEIAGMPRRSLAACVDAIGRARHQLDPAGRMAGHEPRLARHPPGGRRGSRGPGRLAAGDRPAGRAGRHRGSSACRGGSPSADGTLRYVVTRLCYEPGESIAVSVEEPPTRPLAPLNDYRAEGAASSPPRHRVPLRASGPAGRPGRRVHRARPAGRQARGGRPAARAQHRGDRGRRRLPRRRRCTPRASGGWCCSATRPRRWARWPSRSARAIIAALDLAERESIPLEWFAVSAGARISMDSGTENMDCDRPRAAPHRRASLRAAARSTS